MPRAKRELTDWVEHQSQAEIQSGLVGQNWHFFNSPSSKALRPDVCDRHSDGPVCVLTVCVPLEQVDPLGVRPHRLSQTARNVLGQPNGR